MTREISREKFDAMLKVTRELGNYKRKYKRESTHKFVLIALVIILLIVSFTGFDDYIRNEIRRWLGVENVQAK